MDEIVTFTADIKGTAPANDSITWKADNGLSMDVNPSNDKEAEVTIPDTLTNGTTAVSYTHLDVYKRQVLFFQKNIGKHRSLSGKHQVSIIHGDC